MHCYYCFLHSPVADPEKVSSLDSKWEHGDLVVNCDLVEDVAQNHDVLTAGCLDEACAKSNDSEDHRHLNGVRMKPWALQDRWK